VFVIALPNMVNLEHKSLILCLRYLACGLEFWDNNDSNNFHVKLCLSPTRPAPPSSLGHRGRNTAYLFQYTVHATTSFIRRCGGYSALTPGATGSSYLEVRGIF